MDAGLGDAPCNVPGNTLKEIEGTVEDKVEGTLGKAADERNDQRNGFTRCATHHVMRQATRCERG